MSTDHEADVRRIAEAAKLAAELQFDGEQYAVVVIVRKLPFAGLPSILVTNITTGAAHVLRIVDEARAGVPGGKVPS